MAVQDFAKRQGEPFLISPASLWRRMQEKGLILKTEPTANSKKPCTTVQRMIAEVERRVIVLAAQLVESG